MDMNIEELVEHLGSKDDTIRKHALDKLLALTQERVDWIYDYLDILCEKFNSENSFQRNIGAMLIANLAKSDTQGRLADIIDRYIAQMDDVKFITARITLQSAWRFGAVNEAYAKAIAAALVDALKRNRHLITHGNLIRLDAVASLREILKIYPDAADISGARTTIEESCEAKEAMKLHALLG